MMGGIGMTPPPVPTVTYHVALNGAAAGPFDLNTLAQMAATSQITASTLVWKAGMSAWARVDSVDDLKGILANVMPPISRTG